MAVERTILPGFPPPQGLYDPRHEQDECGVGLVANIKGRKSHEVVTAGLEILVNLDHRGAVGADPLVGDGAGCLIQIPDPLIRQWATDNRLDLPSPGNYAVAMCFLPQDGEARELAIGQFEHFIRVEGQRLIGWRDVPVNTAGVGAAVLKVAPVIRQAVIARGASTPDQDAFERKILVIRKQTQNPLQKLAERYDAPALTAFYMPSFSSRTIVYKGLLLAHQIGSFYEDLTNPLTQSAVAPLHPPVSAHTI